MRDEQSTLPEESKRGRIKGASRREPSERLDVGRPKCSGGSSSEHFWIDGLRRRAATKVPQRGKGRAVPECCSSICSTCCQSILEIPEAVVHERDLSIKCVQSAVSESLERLEAENAQLRDTVAELMLEIQALHDGAK